MIYVITATNLIKRDWKRGVKEKKKVAQKRHLDIEI